MTDKDVEITIDGSCKIVDPGSVTLKKSQRDKIKWVVTNNCPSGAVTVTIDNFEDKRTHKTNPFGNNSPGDNRFDIGPVPTGKRDKTKGTKDATGDVGTYKYRISATINGTAAANSPLDPVVIIDN